MAKEEQQRNDALFGPRYHQTICLTGRERAYTIHNYEVNIHASPAASLDSVTSGSSKVQIATITNQNWELPAHPGCIVAYNNRYVTYVLEARNGYVLRLIQQETNARTLLKGFTGPVLDVAFAHATSDLLACVDQGGNLFIWDLDRSPELSEAQSALQLHAKRSSTPDHTHHRLSWCPYVPQEEGDEEDGWMLAVSHGCEVEVYNLGMLLQSTRAAVLHRGQEVPGRFTIPAPHDKALLDLSLSPDGGVLATSSEDGHLKFWQVNWDNTLPTTSLHDFSPHGGAPVTCLIFCDNHTTQDPLAQFWRFLITGANNNTEMKLWCTVSWKCLQTFRFLPPQNSSDSAHPNILLHLDISASYLLVTDTHRMTLYVLQLAMDGLMGQASLTSITEYLLTQPILSFVISGRTPFLTVNGDGESGESGEEGGARGGQGPFPAELDSRRTAVLIKLHCIHTRSMQELQVRFEPPDIMGVPPEPLPVPLFSGDMFSAEPSQPQSSDKPAIGTVDNQEEEDEEEEEVEEEEVEEEEEEGGEVEEEVEERLGQEEEEEEEEEEDRASSTLELFGQPASLPSSLPSSLHPISSGPVTNSLTSPFGDSFHSLPSLPGVSPKLVTPSAFLSATKIDIATSMSVSPAGTTPISSSSKSPRHHAILPTLDTSNVSASSANTLTSVTPSPSLEPSDTTLNSTVVLNTLGRAEDEWRGDEKEKLDREVEFEGEREDEREGGGEEGGEEVGEGGGEGELAAEMLQAGKQGSDVDNWLSGRQSHSQSTAEDGVGGTVRESFGDIFGLAQPLKEPSEPALVKVTPGEFLEGFDNFNLLPMNQRAPMRPQQIFTSTEKSEFVTISSKGITPTREEGTEVVNSTGTPSAEFIEMFSQPAKRESKATTPLGNSNSEMASSYRHSWPKVLGEKLNVSDDNAASAWPDVGFMDMPKLVPMEDLGGDTEAPHTTAEGVGVVSEVSEVGQVGFRSEDSEALREGSSGEVNSFGGLFPSALGTPKLEAAFPMLRVSETTEGETGQTLLTAAEQSTPEQCVLVSADVEEEEEEEEGEGEGEGETARDSPEEGVGEGRGGTVEESTGAAAPQVVEMQLPVPVSSSPNRDQLPGGVSSAVVGGSMPKGKGRRRKNRSKQQPAVGMAAASDGELTTNWETRARLSENQLTPSPTPLSNKGAESMDVVDHTHLTQLHQLVMNQQKEIAALRTEQQRGFAMLHQQLESVQRSTIDEQRVALSDHAREQQQKMDRVLKDKQVLDRQRQDKLISTVSQTLTSAVHAKLEKVVKSEMKNQVTPAVSRSLGSVQEQLSSTVQQRLTATDTALREGINQTLLSKGLPDAVGSAVAGSIRTTVQGIYEETFRAVVLPAFERSTQEMFRQVDDAFRRGITEYLSQLQQQFHQLSEPGLQQLSGSYHALHSLLTSPQSPLYTGLQHEIRSAMQRTIQGVSDGVGGVVREEVEAALQKHAHTLNLETHAHEERARREEEIRQLLQSQDVNRAFEMALSTSDLALVLFLCQQVTLEDVFDKTPCPLSQPVLLSLIQQLSVDLANQVDLKIRYLEASVLALDVTNDITKNHMTQVLQTLTGQLSNAEQSHRSNPNSASLMRLIKRLRMITERLCHSPES